MTGDPARLIRNYPGFDNTWEVQYEFETVPNSESITFYAICVT